jgi:hypothetical protein
VPGIVLLGVLVKKGALLKMLHLKALSRRFPGKKKRKK